jgi:hypothetical protein
MIDTLRHIHVLYAIVQQHDALATAMHMEVQRLSSHACRVYTFINGNYLPSQLRVSTRHVVLGRRMSSQPAGSR